MWLVTWAVRQLCADINYDIDAKHHYSLYETAVLMNSECARQSCIMTSRHNSSKHHFRSWNNDILHVCLMKGASQFQSCRLTTHLTTHLTTDVIIHSKNTFLTGIMMFCIVVIFDVGAQLGRLLTSRVSSRFINKSSTKSWLSTRLMKY